MSYRDVHIIPLTISDEMMSVEFWSGTAGQRMKISQRYMSWTEILKSLPTWGSRYDDVIMHQ